MKSNNLFRDQVNSVTSCFGSWNTCEKIVVLYSLLKQIPPLHCQFLVQMLRQRVSEDSQLLSLEEEANDPGYLCKLAREPKEKAIASLLSHLPLLHPGNPDAKAEYLTLIPDLLAHALDTGAAIEESRQLLSYSLIHPAITGEERSNFNRWLAHLDDCFNHYHPQQDKVDDGQGHPGGQGHLGGHGGHGLQQGQNGITVPPPPTGHMPLSKQSAVGSERLNGWNNHNHNVVYHQSSESLVNLNNGLDGQGHGGSQGNLYGNQIQQAGGQHIHPAGMSGHLPLHATLSAPTNFKPMVPPNASPAASQHHQQAHPTSNTTTTTPSFVHAPPPPPSGHAPLRRMKSMAPPNTLPLTNMSVSEWLKSNDDHMVGTGPGSGGRPGSVLSDHAPLSPQSSTASSSGSDTHGDEGPLPVRNTFMEEASGMRDVPLWLKSLRLHKYSNLFQQLAYNEMLSLSDDWLEQQGVTKGARNKIILSIKKLQERQNSLRNLERDIMEGGPIKSCISEMKAMLNSPLKAFTKPDADGQGGGMLNSPGPGGDADNSIQEGDLPSQFTRLMTKVFTQLMLTPPYDDEGLNMFLQLTDKCINHEAFSQKQKKLLDSFKQQARKMWQPAPVKYSFEKKARPNWGNTFPGGTSFNSRPVQRTGLKTPPKQMPTAMWSFGAKRSVVGANLGTGHLPVQRNNSHSTAILSRQSMMEQAVKQPLARTQSAPLRTQGLMYGSVQVTEPSATDTEINARLDSLCRSVTECALGSLDGNERGSAY